MRVAKRNAGSLACLALAIVASGCHAPPAMQPTKCVCTPNGPCGGYFSTCWRQWPSECVACPPMIEPKEGAPGAASSIPTAPGENIPPPPPRLHDLPGDSPLDLPDEPPPAMLDDEDPAESRSRRNPAAGGQATVRPVERPRAPRTITPRPPVKLATPDPDEPVVFRRTTVELLPPTESEAAGEKLLTPPSYSSPH